ncbi:MAG: right-handed parallel beta-helix repeat-containing protein [Sulfuricaulis sp.]|uniref:right-handed parallel beta-helix repeat-containing protein n=1 Tax=Sulfuricaulis sp. TaxID=2003553 RepID=UPI0025FAEBCD|nr:right-handed parallel beta-helix repeat-containing protein [Sulfuricaulis sp.]MCR4346533.1 right-handed parallel beta-helix repeat-containing protein [Sulfuricaulis sp.]
MFKYPLILSLVIFLVTGCGQGANSNTTPTNSSPPPAPTDTSSPSVTISSPTSSSSYSTSSATINLGGTASDNVGVTQVNWTNSRGGGGTASGTTAWNASGITLQSGSNTLTVTARDAAGNTATDTLVVTYSTTIPGDTTAPVVTISSPTSASGYTTTSGTMTLAGSASDNVGVTQVTWSNSRGGSGTASGTTSWSVGSITLQSGSNVITVTARDAAGNQNTDVLTVAYSVSTSLECSISTVLCVEDTAGANQEYSTIQAAVNVVRPGDTILVHDGSYTGFTISADGTSSSRIVVKAAGSSAVINQANSNSEGITLSNANYVTIEGFTVVGMPDAGIASHNASATSPMRGVIIRNNTVQNSGFMNIYMSQTADSLIEGNIASGAVTSHGIYLANGGSDNTVLRGNRCFNNFKNGIHFNGDSSIGGDGLHSGLTVENNILYNNNDNGVDADGVQDSVFQNNLMYGNGRNALRLFRIDSAQGPKNIKVINNTLIVPSGGGWAIKFSEDLGGHVIFNNILLSENSSTGSISMPNTNFVSNNNALVGRLTYNGESSIVNLSAWQTAGFDANSFTTTSSSLFVNAGAANYQLKAGAPAIDTGRISLNNVLAPLADILGASRPQGVTFDMGAYESN